MTNSTVTAIAGSDETPLFLGNISVPCYVLSDGTRVLSGRGMQKSLGIGSRESGIYLTNILTRYENRNEEIIKRLNEPILFKRKGAGGSAPNTNGYDATLLIDICDWLIQAKNDGKLNEKEIEMAKYAEMIIRSVAKVGIIALIDEATGYQYTREKDELQKILKAYIAEELLPWQKKFPDVFYRELFRLNGWDFTVKGIKKRPGVVGTWTNKLIYEQLPGGVLQALKDNTPISKTGNRIANLHQSLSLDVGDPHLQAQLNQIVTLFQLSENMAHMWSQFELLKKRQSGQLELPFKFDNKGHTIEPVDESQMSHFDKKLKKALEFDSNKKLPE